MGLKRCHIAAFLLFFVTLCQASPAYRGDIRISQPDGSSFIASITGDEYGHLVRLKDGAAILQDKDGYYKYAELDRNGKVVVTEYVAGRPVPAGVSARSIAVPLRSVSKVRPQSFGTTLAAEDGGWEEDEGPRTYKVFVCLIQFQDLEFKNGISEFHSLLDRAVTYFQDQVDGKYLFQFDLSREVTLSRDCAYYGENDSDGNDKRAEMAVLEAVSLLDPEVDFTDYDFLYLFYAGGSPADGSAGEDHIWPHKLLNYEIRTDEKTFNGYSMSAELMRSQKTGNPIFTGIGTFCHEFCHELGLVDLYDTDGDKSGSTAEGMWISTSIMDGGCYNDNSNTPPCFNAIELEMLGIVEPEPLSIGSYTLRPISEQKRVLRMDTDNPGEYFLFECRAASGWDKYMAQYNTLEYLNITGMLVYHVDRSGGDAGYSEYYDRSLTADARWRLNEVNARKDHQCADLLEAYPSANSIQEVFFPYNTYNEFSAKSFQRFRFWDGQLSPLSVMNITRNGSGVSFMVAGPIVLDVQNVYQDAFILNWHTDIDSYKDAPAELTLTTPEETFTYEVHPYESGKFSHTFESLRPGTEYSFALRLNDGLEEGSSISNTFTTKAVNGMPFIYLQDTKRTIRGMFTAESLLPLRVYNAVDASSIVWTLDGVPVTTGPDGFYHLRKSGTLKATVHYPDGSKDIIIKEVTYK